jgi:hypothetical protein
MKYTVDIGIVIGLTSAITAVISLIFAWRAVRVAEKNNMSGLFTELHKIYHDDKTFDAIKTIWEVYNRQQEDANGKLISREQAMKIVKIVDEQDKESPEWKAIHNMSLFWKYSSLLVQNGYLDEEIAFEAFTSPRMLGLLAPIEKAFIEYYHHDGEEIDLQTPLMWLYNRWKKYSRKHKSKFIDL